MVFLDESGSNIALTRLSARAPKGKRARGSLPRNRGKNMTLMASLTLRGMGEALILDGAAGSGISEKDMVDCESQFQMNMRSIQWSRSPFIVPAVEAMLWCAMGMPPTGNRNIAVTAVGAVAVHCLRKIFLCRGPHALFPLTSEDAATRPQAC